MSFWNHTNHLNTPRLVADATATSVWKWDQQEPFGTSAPDENPSGAGTFGFPLRFAGQYADAETNLSYNYFRDYDSSLGRYLESDPIGLRGGLNTFTYVNDNALTRIDRLGLREEGGLGGGSAGRSPVLGGLGSVFTPGTPSNNAFVQSVYQIGRIIKACLASSPAVPPDRINRCKEAFKWCLGDTSISEEKCFEAYSSCTKTTNPFIFPGYGLVD